MRQGTKEWLKQAQYDLETAEIMFKSTRYVYTVFMCHLAIEKALKALFEERTSTIPPRIHNLIKLAKITQANLNKTREVIQCLKKNPLLKE